MLASYEARRQKALREIFEYRDDLARRLRDTSSTGSSRANLSFSRIPVRRTTCKNAPDYGN